jgi:hypothetical protein
MATAKPNILINSISGRIGNVVFYKRLGTQCARVHVIPRNPDTEARRAVRKSFGNAVRTWQSMSPDERYTYIRKTRYLNMSGYNLFISNYLKRIMQDEPKLKVPSLPWNLELSTLHLFPVPEHSRRVPSVSESYMKANAANAVSGHIKLRPG